MTLIVIDQSDDEQLDLRTQAIIDIDSSEDERRDAEDHNRRGSFNEASFTRPIVLDLPSPGSSTNLPLNIHSSPAPTSLPEVPEERHAGGPLNGRVLHGPGSGEGRDALGKVGGISSGHGEVYEPDLSIAYCPRSPCRTVQGRCGERRGKLSIAKRHP